MLLDTQSASAIYGLSVSFLNKRRVQGGGPPYLKVGRKVLYNEAKFEEWLAAQERTSTSQPAAAIKPAPARQPRARTGRKPPTPARRALAEAAQP
jgi:hypothetical protein